MNETVRVVSLKCVCCGARLEIDSDMNAFACGYCGNELCVERRGGTVALRQVVDAVENVQRSTDIMAAELALARLEKEREALRAEFGDLRKNLKNWMEYYNSTSAFLLLMGLGAGFILFMIPNTPDYSSYFWKTTFMVACAAFMAWAYKRRFRDWAKLEWRYQNARAWLNAGMI